MSKLIDAMQLRETGNHYAELGEVAVTKEVAYNYERNLDLYEYRLQAIIGVDLRVRQDQLGLIKKNAENCIREEVFGEYRSLLYRIKQAAYNRDFQKVSDLVSQIERSMFDV